MRLRNLLSSLLSVGLLASSTALAQPVPPSPVIDPAASLHVSRQGLDALGEAIKGIVPRSVSATGLTGSFECDEETGDTLTYAAEDIVVRLQADTVAVVPLQNRIEVDLGLTLWSEPADISLNGTCLVELDEVCNLALPPTPINANLGIQIVLQDGELLTNVTDLDIVFGNFGNPVGTGCLIGDALETFQGFGVDLIGSILQDLIAGQLGDLEGQLEEILGGITGALAFDTEIDALGTALGINLAASALQIDSQGIKLDFSAQFSTPTFGTCVPASGPYQPVAHDPPAMTGLIPEIDVPYHAGVMVNQDLLGEAVWVAWQGGLLCLRLSDLVDLEITTGYLGLVEPDLVDEIWPEEKALDIRISADAPPAIVFASGEPRLDAVLNLDVYGEELARSTRFWGHGLYADAGVGLGLEDGTLVIDVDFDLETQLGITISYNEWLPQAIPEGFAGLIPSLAGQFVDLETLVPSFDIPAVFGITLADLDLRVVGDNDDYLGLYLWLDPTAAEAIEIPNFDLAGAGCDENGDFVVPGCEGGDDGCAGLDTGLEGCSTDGGDGGCGGCGDSGGCGEGGCSTARGYRAGIRLGLLFALPLLVWRRRRR